MATLLDVRDLGLHLADVVSRVRAGEEVTISDGGEPVVRMSPARAERPVPQFGTLAGQAWMADDFDAPLPDDLMAEFEK